MNSMTGFGRANVEREGRKISLELKSVNHRYLDLNIRVPKALSPLEELIREKIKASLSRGHVDVYIYYKNTRNDARQISVDDGLATAYADAFKKVKSITGVRNDITTANIARMSDVLIVSEAEENEDELKALLSDAMDIALEGLCSMRAREGKSIMEDMLANVDSLEECLKIVEKRAPLVPAIYREKLTVRLEELMKDSDIKADEQRIAAEIAIYCDKCSIDEEISRLTSHINEFRQKSLEENEVGRSMDFLVQEMNRETNTICSKANDIEITNTGLAMKNLVEKIREQIQNVE